MLNLDVREIRLENGLTLLFLEDHTAPVFTIMLWLPAGGRTEADGQSGISHFLEHCYSLGSSKLAPREIDRLVQSLGGQKNAFTGHDYTAYYESLPKAALEKIVEVEADRLAALLLPADRLASELDVVREERRLRYENAPAGAVMLKLLATAYERHPYGKPVIGTAADLDRLSRDVAVDYYRKHYAPANATYALVGDFDPAAAEALFRRWFGGIPAGVRPAVEPAAEPEQTAERRATLRRASVRLPRLSMLWKVPPLDHPDTAALEVLQMILFEGEAARCERLLRRERKLVTWVGGGHWEYRDPGPFTLDAEAQEGIAIEAVERAADEVVEAVRDRGVEARELERAKRQFGVAFLTGLESTSARARAIGRYHVTSARGAGYLTDYVARIEAVTREDVQRVAQRYLRSERRTVVWLVPGKPEEEGAAASAHPERRGSEATPESKGEPPGEVWGDARKWRLANGLTVLYQHVPRLPTVAVGANVRAGAMADPTGKAGLAAATLDLLKCGTRERDEEAFADAFASLGASLTCTRGPEAVSLGTSLLARDFEAALGLLAEVLQRPAFPAEKLERVRKEMLAERASIAAKPEELLVEAFYKEVYAGTPYEQPINGTEASLAGLTLEDVKAFHGERYAPGNVTLAVVGDVEPGRLRAAVEGAFGGWASAAATAIATSTSTSTSSGAKRRVIFIEKADQTQAHVRIGAPAIPRNHADWDALSMAHVVLGGAGLSSRITDVVRTKNGLAYSAGTVLIPREQRAGPIAAVAQTKSASAGKAIELMLAEMERIRAEPVAEEELGRAKALFAGSLPFRLETNAQKAGVLLDGDLYGLGPDHLRRQIARIEALTAADVQAAAQKHIRPAEMTIAVVAARADVEPQLERFRPGQETPA